MKILSVSNLYNFDKINKSSNIKRYNCSFKAEFWEDDYDPGSIFYWQEKKEKAKEIAEADFTSFRNNVGYKVTTGPLADAKINSLRYLGNNTYKGGMIEASKYLKEIKDSGIQKMIVLCSPEECDIVNACKENNMNWTKIFVPLTMRADTGEKDFEGDFNWNRFVNIVKDLRNGNVFIGCESGNLRTKRFLNTVKILDPKFKLNLAMSDADGYDYVLANWIYKGLSSIQKQVLDYTQEFERNLERDFQLYIPMKFK